MIRGARGQTRERIRRFVDSHTREHGTFPSYRQIQDSLGGGISRQTVHRHLMELSNRRLIAEPSRSRHAVASAAEGRLLKRISKLMLHSELGTDEAAETCGLPVWIVRVIRNAVSYV
jgi:predicted transcriptional regulator